MKNINNLNKNKKKIAFSLIELSIVLIIIGLLVAGITGGASLIKSAKIRSLMNEVQNMKTGIYSYYAASGKLPAIDEATGKMSTIKSCDGWNNMVEEGIIDKKIEKCDTNLTFAVYNETFRKPFSSADLSEDTESIIQYGLKSKNDSGYFVFGYKNSLAKNTLGLLSNNIFISGVSLYGFISFSQDRPAALGVLDNKIVESIDKKIDDGVYDTGNIVTSEICRYDTSFANCPIFFGLD